MTEDRDKTILLVEDEAIIAMTEAMILEKYGYKTITADTGEKAIEIVNITPDIDLVLMDINLGKGIDGTQAAEIILDRHTIPIIFLSSHTEREIVEKTEGITSYGYIVKNSGETVLIASMKMAFRLYESQMKGLESDAFRKRVFESSAIPIVVMDPQTFNYVDCNAAALSIYGFKSMEEALRKNLMDVSPPKQYDGIDSSVKARNYVDTVIAEGITVFEWLYQRPGGELWDAEVHLMSFYSKGRLFLHFTLLDITDRKRLEKIQQIQHKLIIDLNSCSDLHDGLNKVLTSAMQLESIDCGAVYIVNPNDGSIDMAVHHGISKEFAATVSHFTADSPNVRMLLSGEIYHGPYAQILAERDEISEKEGLRAFTAIPIMNQGKLIAAFNLASHTYYLLPPATRIALETIAYQIGGTLLRLRTDTALRKSEERFRAFFNKSWDGIIIINNQGKIVEWNPGEERITGIPRSEALHRPVWEIQHQLAPKANKDAKFIRAAMEKTLHGLEDGTDFKPMLNEEIHLPDGSTRFIQSSIFIIKSEGEIFAGGIIRDITEQKRIEDENRRLIQEKELLLKEVHHRIKNNIASIESLLVLRSNSINNPEALSLIQDSISRIQSMRILYENLLISENYTEMSSKAYFEKLINAIISIFPNNSNITIEKNISDFNISSKVIITTGIIVNELITNAMKYAFADRERGLLQITISRDLNNISIIIADNGIGLPAGFNMNEPKGFGFMLVGMLVKQIRGSIELQSEKGTRCKIEFKTGSS